MPDLLAEALERLDMADRRLAKRFLVEVELGVGERITSRGDDDPALAWVSSGAVELRVGHKSLVQIAPGGIVGGEDFYGDQRRSFTAVASAPTRLLVVDARALQRLRERVPSVAAVLELGALRSFCDLLRGLDHRAVDHARAFFREHSIEEDRSYPLLSSIVDSMSPLGGPSTWAHLRLPPAFELLPGPIRETLRDVGSGISLGAGQVLVREGAESEAVYLIADGGLQVLATVSEGISLRLGEVGPNAVVGVTSALDSNRHSASCVAVGPVKAVRVDRAAWSGLLSVEAPAGSSLRTAVLRSMSAWIPPIRDRVECSERCLRGVIHAHLFTQ